jgi:Cu(I)/Ag(I) efflux system membrane protein CusA/SilA
MKTIIRFFLENRLVTFLFLIIVISWGIVVAPFDWHAGLLPKDPVPVDAIPDIGENQQIVATEWMGRSPQDIEDQITYPLTTSLLGIPGVKDIRSTSMFGMSFIYIIFEEQVEFYWSRSRILEKLNSLPPGLLPEGVQPALGPDATALGQIYWYTLEGRDPKTGKPTGGWSGDELRSIQDFQIKYALSSAKGVSEVASVGGYVKEYQVDIDPEAMKAFGVDIMQIMEAVRKSNLDVGAETMEINKVEYAIRGLGYVKSLADLEEAVVTVREQVPVRVKDVARVNFGPATRRGGLDKGGAEAVGAVVTARYGSNPLEVINQVKEKIAEIAPGLPEKVLPDGTVSKVTIVPFYDRTDLIKETIGTLEHALTDEIVICVIVIILLVLNLKAALIVSGILPVGVLATFILMKYTGVDANIVALSGIAIAIGVMIDVGVVFVENILRHMDLPENKGARGKQLLKLVYESVAEVSSAIVTGMLTTVVSFIPVFFLEAQEGKMFRPLAFTKTYALGAALVLSLVVIPTLAYTVFNIRVGNKRVVRLLNYILCVLGVLIPIFSGVWPAIALTLVGLNNLFLRKNVLNVVITVAFMLYLLTANWLPLGPEAHFIPNFLFSGVLIGVILVALMLVVKHYERLIRWCLDHKLIALSVPVFTILWGLVIWLGWNGTFGFVAKGFDRIGVDVRTTAFWSRMSHHFPSIGSEFMPSLDEGSFLLMPTSMPHTGVEKNIEYVRLLDQQVESIPEVEVAVGKWGRVNSALDPANTQMFEQVINYKPEYRIDADGKRIRQWRDHIHSPEDIWQEIVRVTQLPGLTSAPKLQPIETRLVMLSTGMRAPMGIKVYGPDVETIEKASVDLERLLKEVPAIQPASVFAERGTGAPYLELQLNRPALARHGIAVADLQEMISVAIGGMELSRTVEGRERFPIRVRYARELRASPESLKQIRIPTAAGVQVPLGDLVDIRYTSGPQMIRSENTFLTGYVLFDKQAGVAEVDAVHQAQAYLNEQIASGAWKIPAGVSYRFAGNYEQQERAASRLALLIPLCLLSIFLILYFQFRTVTASLIHFSGVFVAFAGGFILLWLYGQSWFLDVSIGGTNLRDLFQIHPINLSIAVWVGFIALFGIATDDGVLMGTYIHQVFRDKQPATVHEVREAVVEAGLKRVRPAMMTTASTLIALLPVLSSLGKGSDVMVPMAIPTFGGMTIQIMTMFVVPILQCLWREGIIKKEEKKRLKMNTDETV